MSNESTGDVFGLSGLLMLEALLLWAHERRQFREFSIRARLGLADSLDALTDRAFDVLQSIRLWAYAAL